MPGRGGYRTARRATLISRREGRAALALALLLFGLYALTAGGHTDSSDGEGYFQTSRSLLRGDHALELSADNGRITPARPGRDGAPVGIGGIGYPVVMAPFTAAGEAIGRAVDQDQAGVAQRLLAGFANPLVSALTAAVLLLAALRLGAPLPGAVLLALAYGLGTMAWPASGSFFSEPLTALLLVTGVLAALRAADAGRLTDAALAGLATGTAVLARPSAIVFVPIVGLYVAWARWRSGGPRPGALAAAAFATGALACLGLSALANWWRYGDGGDSGYGATPLDGSLAEGLHGLLLSPGKSIFLYAPIALIAVVAVPAALRRRPAEVAMLCALVLANLAVFARFPFWHGDAAWGPRYLLITLPVMVLLAAPVLAAPGWRRAVAVAGAIGVVPALLGTLVSVNQYTAIVRERTSAAVAADGTPAYWDDLHFSARDSPLVGHAEALPDAIANAAARLDGADPSFASGGLFPTSASQRFSWYDEPAQLDVWPYWIVVEEAPRRLLLLGLVPLGALVGGGLMLRRLRREDGA